MTREERERAIEILKSEILEPYKGEFTEEQKCVAIRMAIEALSEPTKTEPTIITENMTNGDIIKTLFPNKADFNGGDGVYFNKSWWNAPYKSDFTMPTRPKAKWIRRNRAVYHCSNCHYTVHQKYDFCVCGAEMESE